MRLGSSLALFAALAIPHAAVSQQESRSAAASREVTFEVTGVHSDTGTVRVSLCGDTRAPFPGGCVTHSGVQPAKRGGAEIPPEGYAFGNGAPFPPPRTPPRGRTTGRARSPSWAMR